MKGDRLLTFAMLGLAALGAADSLPGLRRCSRPKDPLGFVQSSGTVSFHVSKRGTVDIASLAVVSLTGGSVQGLRSALARQLPACRFRPAQENGRDSERSVVARVRFEIDTLRLEIVGTSDSALALEPVALGISVSSTDTVASTDSRLDELPRPFECRYESRDVVVTKVRVDGRFVENPPTPVPAMLNPPPMPAGEALLAYVVPVSGKVDHSRIHVRRATSSTHASAGAARVASCKWAPGRVGGVPVAVRVSSLERFD